jgi:hypothetical protein
VKDLEQIPDGDLTSHRLRQGQVEVHCILIHASRALLVQVASGFEFRDDAAHRPLGQSQGLRDLPGRDLALLGNEEQHRAVVGDKTPFWHRSPPGEAGGS